MRDVEHKVISSEVVIGLDCFEVRTDTEQSLSAIDHPAEFYDSLIITREADGVHIGLSTRWTCPAGCCDDFDGAAIILTNDQVSRLCEWLSRRSI